MESRSARVSEVQWNILLDFLASNPDLAKTRGYNNTARGRANSARLWSEVAARLNAEGSGTTKTPKNWSIYVSNHKSKLKKIVADINTEISGTGGGPAATESLSDTDRRFLAILGPGFGLPTAGVGVNPFPDTATRPQPSTSATVLQTPHSDVEATETPQPEYYEVLVPYVEEGDQQVVVEPPAPEEPSDVAGAAAPPLPRQTRRTRQRSRPLAPLDEARRILSQIETQRLASDAATARALDLIGRNLGRLADAAESYIQRQ